MLRFTATIVGTGFLLRASGLATWHDRIGSFRVLRWRGRWILATPLLKRSLRDAFDGALVASARFLSVGSASLRWTESPALPVPHARAWHHRHASAGLGPEGMMSGATSPRVRVETGVLTLDHGPVGVDLTRTGSPPGSTADRPSFPIDVVYTWVDGDDPAWRARCEAALQSDRAPTNGQAVNRARFRNRDELRYSLRSLARYAPFVRNVYVVTDGQVPPWLDLSAPGLHVVPHHDILEFLPTFNSHAIETALHRVEGLAEHYLYLNDDFFFGRECDPWTFFTEDGRTRIFPDPRAIIPAGPSQPGDRGVDSASKNTRDLIHDTYDLMIEHKMQHTPYAQRRSVLQEMEDRFPYVFKQTAQNPFRHHTDVNVASCLSHYYGFATGTAVPGFIEAAYVNIGNPWAPLQLRRLLRQRDRKVFCLNEGAVSAKRPRVVDASVRTFLETYFPEPSPYELDH
jgi:hypothetical protein